MQRPLTAADRVPQVGDVMYDEGSKKVSVIRVLGGTYDGYAIITSILPGERPTNVRMWWRYAYRADGGSITTEGGS